MPELSTIVDADLVLSKEALELCDSQQVCGLMMLPVKEELLCKRVSLSPVPLVGGDRVFFV